MENRGQGRGNQEVATHCSDPLLRIPWFSIPGSLFPVLHFPPSSTLVLVVLSSILYLHAPATLLARTTSIDLVTRSEPLSVCVGDCGGTHRVAINDIIALVNIALGTTDPA